MGHGLPPPAGLRHPGVLYGTMRPGQHASFRGHNPSFVVIPDFVPPPPPPMFGVEADEAMAAASVSASGGDEAQALLDRRKRESAV
jgi:hypothetical protein